MKKTDAEKSGRDLFPIFFLMISTFAASTPAHAGPFSVVGWQLHHDDEARAVQIIDMAAQYGVNHLQLSHGLIMNIDQLSDEPERAARIERIAKRAREKGIETYVWTHEFNVRDLTACLDPGTRNGRAFWSARREAYKKGFEAVPDVAGAIMSFGSSHPDPWFLVCTCGWCMKHDNADRVKAILDIVGGVVEKDFGKTVYARTFIHTPEELQWVGDALRRSPTRPTLRVMSKEVPQDWEPYYPDNPLIGDVGGHGQIVEVDLGAEYWGKGLFPMDLTEYLRHRARHARDAGALGFVARVERGADSLFGTANEINLHAFHALLEDPDRDATDIRLEWMEKRYGLPRDSEAAGRMADIFRDSFDAVRKMYYNLGFWTLEKGSDLTDAADRPKLLAQRSVALYDPKFKPREEALTAPDAATFDRIMAEKSEAVAIARRMRDGLDGVEGLKVADRAELEAELDRLSRAAEVWRLANGALWARQLFLQTGDSVHKEWAAGFAADLEALAGTLPKGQAPGGPDRIASFLESFRRVQPEPAASGAVRYDLKPPFVSGLRLRREGARATAAFSTPEPAVCRMTGGSHLMEFAPVTGWEPGPGVEHRIASPAQNSGTRFMMAIECRRSDGSIVESGDYWMEF